MKKVRTRKTGMQELTIAWMIFAVLFLRLDIGINAVAHSCNMSALPGKGDKIGIVVTRINDNYEVAEGIITRLIKRWK